MYRFVKNWKGETSRHLVSLITQFLIFNAERFDMFIYCSTEDSPKMVGEAICGANCNGETHSWTVSDEGEFCIINVNSEVDCVAVVYQVSDLVVGIEIGEDCGFKFIEPLMKTYGFENVKWLA